MRVRMSGGTNSPAVREIQLEPTSAKQSKAKAKQVGAEEKLSLSPQNAHKSLTLRGRHCNPVP